MSIEADRIREINKSYLDPSGNAVGLSHFVQYIKTGENGQMNVRSIRSVLVVDVCGLKYRGSLCDEVANYLRFLSN